MPFLLSISKNTSIDRAEAPSAREPEGNTSFVTRHVLKL